MPRNPSHQELETVAQLRIALRRFVFATDQVTERHGLTSREYDLLALLNAPGQDLLSAGVISDQLCLSASATTELITPGVACRAARAATRPGKDAHQVRRTDQRRPKTILRGRPRPPNRANQDSRSPPCCGSSRNATEQGAVKRRRGVTFNHTAWASVLTPEDRGNRISMIHRGRVVAGR